MVLVRTFLSDLLLNCEPSRTLRSLDRRTKTYDEAAYYHYSPRLWNSLPEDLRAAEIVNVFKSNLKTSWSAWLVTEFIDFSMFYPFICLLGQLFSLFSPCNGMILVVVVILSSYDDNF